MADQAEKLMTKGEVAAYCRVETRTVDRWMRKRRIKFLRLPGGYVRFKKSHVDEALDGHFDNPGGDAPDPSLG